MAVNVAGVLSVKKMYKTIKKNESKKNKKYEKQKTKKNLIISQIVS